MKTMMAMVVLGVMTVGCAARGTEYHVAVTGNDGNGGTASAPLRTIQKAAELARPGDTVTVHAGVYRERVNPPRGGESDSKRIVYQAAAGEKVQIKGSEVVKGWVKEQGDVWKVVLPNSMFGTFNPYSDEIRGDWFNGKGRKHHTGAVYVDGHWLVEAATLEDLTNPTSRPTSAARSGVLLNVAWMRPEKGKKVSAAGFAAQQGLKKAPCSEGGECIGWIEDGDWAIYNGVDFGEEAQRVEVRAASASAGGRIEVRRDRPDGELLGSCIVPNTGGWQAWQSFQVGIKPVRGVGKLCLRFSAPVQVPAELGALWFASVDEKNTTIWAQFKGVDPNKSEVEINVRKTVFYPDRPGRNYITVRGFAMRHAATNWAPPTAEQVGLIGTHWSKGWIIENNTVSHSVCSGIALGKYGDEFDNTSANSAEGYVKTIERATARGWSKENIGHHVVRNNHISHCEQTGIVGSLGPVFCTVTDNVIHDIHVRRLFTGAEMAGIKFHAAIDTLIARNHIYRTCRGIWLDWMTQGTRVTRNLLHDNATDDLYVEVNHGPFLIDNNVLLSPIAIKSYSQGGAYVHNLIGGRMTVRVHEKRVTPYHKAHSTEVAGMRDNPSGDDRFYNNLLVGAGDLSEMDNATLPVAMDGNVYLKGTKASKHEKAPVIQAQMEPGVRVVQKADGVYLEMTLEKGWAGETTRKLVTTALLGKASIPDLPWVNPDDSPLKINVDYFGRQRNESNPTPGPFENVGTGRVSVKVR